MDRGRGEGYLEWRSVGAVSGGLWWWRRRLEIPMILLPNVVIVQWGAAAPVDGSSPPESVPFSALFLLFVSFTLYLFFVSISLFPLFFFSPLFSLVSFSLSLYPLCSSFDFSSQSPSILVSLFLRSPVNSLLFCWFPPFPSLSLSFFLLPSSVLLSVFVLFFFYPVGSPFFPLSFSFFFFDLLSSPIFLGEKQGKRGLLSLSNHGTGVGSTGQLP